jgi:16S rRNA (uracil1498-N3)-methyltransferase
MISKINFLFYCPDIQITNCLDTVDSQHCVKVLRNTTGDKIHVTDGKGGWYLCQITDANPKKCQLVILEQEQNYQKPSREISLAICPTKSADRIEYLIEKAVEIGLHEVFFVSTQNTYPKRVNMERMTKIAVSAMKQSLKAYLPILHDYSKLDVFLKNTKGFNQKFLAHLDHKSQPLTAMKITDNPLIFVGPEGDFSEGEIELINQNGFETVTLGSSRLRTETAGVVSVSLLNLLP